MNSSSINRDTIVSVRGSVVDIHFEHTLPELHSLLTASEQIVIEVLTYLNANVVRGIALSKKGLARGSTTDQLGQFD